MVPGGLLRCCWFGRFGVVSGWGFCSVVLQAYCLCLGCTPEGPGIMRMMGESRGRGRRFQSSLGWGPGSLLLHGPGCHVGLRRARGWGHAELGESSKITGHCYEKNTGRRLKKKQTLGDVEKNGPGEEKLVGTVIGFVGSSRPSWGGSINLRGLSQGFIKPDGQSKEWLMAFLG